MKESLMRAVSIRKGPEGLHKLVKMPNKNMFTRKLTVFSLILILGLAPAFSYAKDNGNGKKRGKNIEKSERVEINKDRRSFDDEDDDDFVNGVKLRGDGSIDDDDDDNKERGRKEYRKGKKNGFCRIAFGHLFAPGYIKNWGEVDRDRILDCLLPFGIDKKFHGLPSSATTTPDTIPPVISDIVAKPNTTKAVITWHTDERSDSAVFWSTSAGVNVNSSSTSVVTRNEGVKDHKIVLENLAASTTYYFIVRSKDASGNTSTSTEKSFVTKAVASDTNPPVISSVALIVGTSTANVSWHTNENATSKVYYGTQASLDVNATSTTFLENTSLKENHLISLSNLATSTLYYFAAESRDASGNRTVTPVFSASTSN